VNPISNFASQVGASISLRPNLVVNKLGRYFLLNEVLLRTTRKNFYYAGLYLGKVSKARFFPSFDLLAILAKGKSNKIVVDSKTAWLFVCGRDIFQQGILSVEGSKSRGAHTLVLNEYDECLGFGRIIYSLLEKREGVAVKNISDIGDFLRRET
jgi:ribosome biogenesis protein Nip4